MDPIRAQISRGFLLRLGLVAFTCLGLTMWCIYDGTVTYPKDRLIFEAFSGLAKQIKTDDPSLSDEAIEEELSEKWPDVAAEHGWPADTLPVERNKYAETNQFIMAGGVAPIGVLFLFFLVRNRGRWIEAGEQGVTTSWGQSLEYGHVVGLNKKKWNAKGIAVINYEAGGRRQRLVLDDCKYDIDETKQIMMRVESEIDEEQIVGSLSEAAKKAARQADEEAQQQTDDSENEGTEDQAQTDAGDQESDQTGDRAEVT